MPQDGRGSRPGNVRGALNDLGEGLRDAAGVLVDLSGRLISGAVGGASSALDGFASSAADAIRAHWEALSDATRALFRGLQVREQTSATVVELNYDAARGAAANESLRLLHAPWATCEDCFFRANVSAALEIAFDASGVPQKFHAEAGASLRGRLGALRPLPNKTPARALPLAA